MLIIVSTFNVYFNIWHQCWFNFTFFQCLYHSWIKFDTLSELIGNSMLFHCWSYHSSGMSNWHAALVLTQCGLQVDFPNLSIKARNLCVCVVCTTMILLINDFRNTLRIPLALLTIATIVTSARGYGVQWLALVRRALEGTLISA